MREARLTEAIGGNLRAGGHCRVRTPRVLTQLSSARLLVLERMEGENFDVALTGLEIKTEFFDFFCPLCLRPICRRFWVQRQYSSFECL